MSGGIRGSAADPPKSADAPSWVNSTVFPEGSIKLDETVLQGFLLELASPRTELQGVQRPKLSTEPASPAHRMMEFVRNSNRQLARSKPRSTEMSACRAVEGACFAAILHQSGAASLAACLAIDIETGCAGTDAHGET